MDMIKFKATDQDYIKGFCGERGIAGEGVDVAQYPSGWKPVVENGTVTAYTGCEKVTGFPGLGTTSFQSHAAVKEMLQTLPRRQNDGEVWRGNELGLFVCNSLFWSKVNPRSLLLGATVKQHKVIRPFLDELYATCDSGCAARLSASAGAFIAARKSLNIQSDVKIWVNEELFRITFPGEANPLSGEDFVSLQSSFTTLTPFVQIVPQWFANLMARDTVAKLEAYFAAVRPLVVKHYGARLAGQDCAPTLDCVDQLTSALIDTLLLAGGLSVPSGISTALWVMYGNTAPHGDIFPADFRMDTNNVLPFFYESLRFFAPVVGVPFWEPAPARATDDTANQFEGGKRIVMNVALANQDPNVYGADAHKFRVRAMSEYHSKFIGFADFAVDASVADGTMNRVCPGKALALQLGKAWLQQWDQDAWAVEGEEKSNYKMVAPLVDSFVLRRK
eukprot:TRINITY_DN399_c1_g1_i13.p1 TRINITY_DN399_c1_g1~~TRINITY_DN399_c1_g1_i13.p1  ORF type:complete len:524 (+),score=214.72 TRINITY_DN399_c1_g1_i13:233-1573(+)